jgi:HK97 gp10 family phage protein
MFRVGVMGGAKLNKDNKDEGPGGPTPHFRLLEFGTEKMAARPFFARALSENAQKATDVFISQFSAAIDRALRRSGK